MKNYPKYEPEFSPLYLAIKDFNEKVQKEENHLVQIVVERNGGYNYVLKLNVFSAKEKQNSNFEIVERLVKTLCWLVGGCKVYVCGDDEIYEMLKKAYQKGGIREFDADFMAGVYEKPTFEVVRCDLKDLPEFKDVSMKIGGNLDGCRIGFDAGGSDRKVSAVIDGKTVYSEETIWHPKEHSDYQYHYDGIKDSFKTAASYLPRVDAIGVSSAGVYVDNKIMVASLFNKIPKDDFDKHIKTLFLDLAKEFNTKIEVANDGDVTALCGSMELKSGCVLGIAMGTSQAGGYIDKNGGIKGWLNELAFVPVDFNKNACIDEWSGDYGCGSKYFSQDAVIKLAQKAGIKLNEQATLAEKLVEVQEMAKSGDERALDIFRDIGVYLAHTIPFYAMFYDIKYVQLLGRVTSGVGGNEMLKTANRVIKEEYPEYADIVISMPDESNRRVGQSIAAASLPKIN